MGEKGNPKIDSIVTYHPLTLILSHPFRIPCLSPSCLQTRYSLFEPADGAKRLEESHMSAKQVEDAEVHLLTSLVALLSKASYKPLTSTEFELATKEQYMLNVPVAVDAAKVGVNH